MTHIKITAGQVVLEYEGDEDFDEESLINILDNVTRRAATLPAPVQAGPATAITPASVSPTPSLSTNTIAQILDVKTGSDLAFAAIVHINLVEKEDKASRQKVLDDMRSASTYFRETYVSNLTSYLDTLVKNGRVNMVARNVYALSASERRRAIEAIRQADGMD